MLTAFLVLLSTAAWSQEAEPAEAPAEPDAPAQPAGPADVPPMGEAPPAQPPPPERQARPRDPRPNERRPAARQRCETWEVSIWHLKKSGCKSFPNANNDEWCAVPEGMAPVAPIDDAGKWWVKRCADPVPEPPRGNP